MKMPAQDKTGPEGQGQATGRGLGPCRRGLAFRHGFERGYWCRQPITLSKEEEKKILEAEIKEIDLEKEEIEKRIKELK